MIEKPKKEVKEEGEEEPQEEDNPEGVPKFKPENFKWTTYDGLPRNYVQVLKRLKMYPVDVIKSNNCRDDLIKVIKNHLDKLRKKEENNYEGNISVINVENEISEETNENVNSLVNIDVYVEEKEENVEEEKEKNQKDKDAKSSGKK